MIMTQLIKKFLTLYGKDDPLQESTSYPYSGPHETKLQPDTLYLQDYF
jgi:hypothetical protein